MNCVEEVTVQVGTSRGEGARELQAKRRQKSWKYVSVHVHRHKAKHTKWSPATRRLQRWLCLPAAAVGYTIPLLHITQALKVRRLARLIMICHSLGGLLGGCAVQHEGTCSRIGASHGAAAGPGAATLRLAGAQHALIIAPLNLHGTRASSR